ncbi:hypothetical protein NDU88_001947 [Pleurodeles waltl]|uniref:Uncharacterized protein n=1 Tax=Pleurodeles waltl TaxID=8319 RepID=A0AAV7NLN8_PLEWA|nr:hypothetical protein NDU88_001947 [Pleurodeles waltl]
MKSDGPRLGPALGGAPQQHAGAPPAVHSPISGAPSRHGPQVSPPPLRADPVSALGLLLARPAALPGHPSSGATSDTSDTESKGPRGQNKSLQPRGPRGSTRVARAAARPRRDQAPRCTLAPGTARSPGAVSRPPAFLIARGQRPTVRPARMNPGPSSGPSRAPTAPKASQGLTQGIARARPSQHCLQDK